MRCTLIFFSALIFQILASCGAGKGTVSVRGDAPNYMPYYLKVYQADSLYLVNDRGRSYQILDSLFRYFEPLNMPIYNEYENYVRMGAELGKSRRRDVAKLVELHDYRLSDLKGDSLLSIALKRSGLSDGQVNRMHRKFESRVDTVYRNLLHAMNASDQEVRLAASVDWKAVRRVDLENDSLLGMNLRSKGFPTVRVVGSYKKLSHEADSKDVSIDAVLIHLSVDNFIFEAYREKILHYVRQGECPPKVYAFMVDKNYVTNHDESYFHFMFSNLLKGEVSEEAKRDINRKRKPFGLPSVDYDRLFYKRRIINN